MIGKMTYKNYWTTTGTTDKAVFVEDVTRMKILVSNPKDNLTMVFTVHI